MSQLRECYKVFKKACDTNKNIRLWANNECFDHTDWSSATLERFKLQTDITAEFAEKNITFAYNNYYSPNNVDAGFHQTYLNYLKTGKLNEEIPSKVSNVSVKHEKNNTIITWDEKQNVAGYFIYKNEKVIGSIKAQRNDGKGYIPKMDCTWKDEANENTNNNYFVACFDYAGNLAVPQKAKLI